MARANLMVAVFIVLLVITYHTKSGEGREMKSHYQGSGYDVIGKGNQVGSSGNTPAAYTVKGVDSFLPTTPGRSPGVGHSVRT
ncbi:hypothetical protein Nepgr_015687 [Nepenthes gracilis]|uniref:Uncharacterized protein n=1 Tax=Nepenthes gracilis TaxID=150966 RepID=A0AAD3XRI7_NEPGR|nr:hypothetical protein Nepgr_015687 [Nepenthes gracilis]